MNVSPGGGQAYTLKRRLGRRNSCPPKGGVPIVFRGRDFVERGEGTWQSLQGFAIRKKSASWGKTGANLKRGGGGVKSVPFQARETKSPKGSA